MKKVMYILFSCLLLSCGHSIEKEATEMLNQVCESKYKTTSGDKVHNVGSEVVYTAPNDSLVILRFAAKTKDNKPKNSYFAYVISEDRSEDFWVIFNDDIISITEECLKDSPLDNDENVRDSFIHLACSAYLYSGKGAYIDRSSIKPVEPPKPNVRTSESE